MITSRMFIMIVLCMYLCIGQCWLKVWCCIPFILQTMPQAYAPIQNISYNAARDLRFKGGENVDSGLLD
jgi:hypothetical protein